METEWLTEQQLLDFAGQHGCRGVNHWKLERWHKEDVITRPVVEHLGYGRGTCSTYPAETAAQILAVCRLLKSTRNFDAVRFQLWREGYPISLPLLKRTIRQLVFPLRWKVPRQEERKYDAAEQQMNTLLQKTSSRFFHFLLKRFGKNLDLLQSFIVNQLYLLYGIPLLFEPSYDQGEPSLTDIFAQGFGVDQLGFLPKDLTADFQQFSDSGLLSITKMNAVLDEATEEDLRRASTRSEVVALIFEWFELIGFLPSPLRSLLLHDVSTPPFQAMCLAFALHLEKNGYANNMDQLLEVLRMQMPRFRAFQALYLALQQELPAAAKALGTFQNMWQRTKNLSEQEREQYFARRSEHLRGIYLHYEAELDAFWQRHPEMKSALEAGDPSSS